MDFSAKHLRKTLTDNPQPVVKKVRVKPTPITGNTKLRGNTQSKEAKAFIKFNTARMYKSALEMRTHCSLMSVDYVSRWWDNIDIMQSLHERGFTIIDDDPHHFGTWYSSIAILEEHEVFELEKFLSIRVAEVSRSRPKVAIQKILKSYLNSNDSRINILRLLLLFNKLWLQDDFDIGDTFIFVNKILPLNLGGHYVEMDGKTESFSISWRYPNEGVNSLDGVSATSLKWLCSNTGNEQFRKLYEAIKKSVAQGNSHVTTKIETSHEGFIVFQDKNLNNISLELTPGQLKQLLESLDYDVAIDKGSTPHSLTIGV